MSLIPGFFMKIARLFSVHRKETFMPSLTTYKLLKQEHNARRGEFKTVHGTVQTPAFQNVATAGAIKGGLSAQDLKDIGAQVMLCNTYHLHLRPGDKLVADMGGLHKFTRWNGPILTDSGGFQVFSLAKLRKIIDRETPDAAKETLLVLDATTGQNGLQQAKVFRETAGLTGIILTKLDGTAKGGVVIGISDQFRIPVRYIGVGERIDQLQLFDRRAFVEALFGDETK